MNLQIFQHILNALRYFTVFVLSVALPNMVSASTCRKDELCNPLKFNSIQGFVEGFLQAVVYVGFPIAVLFVVYSGFKFVFAQGNPEDLAKAKKNFMWTIIGVGLFLGAWALAMMIKGTIAQLR